MIACAGLETIKTIAEVLTAAATLGAGFWAAWTYRQSVRLERAKWMKELYEKFYERPNLKEVRDALGSCEQTEIENLVKTEDSRFTDYLNFFEFLAYLAKSKQIQDDELDDLFQYYIERLTRNATVAAYIEDENKGFGNLANLLKRYRKA